MEYKKCKVDGCDRKAGGNGYCTKHNQQINKHGKINTETERKQIYANSICCVEECNDKVYAKGYCQRHYLQIRNHGKIVATKKTRVENISGKCKVEGCENKHFSKGYCQRHYAQLHRHGKITDGVIKEDVNYSPNTTEKRSVKRCSVKRCSRDYYAKGLCKRHYDQLYNYGEVIGEVKNIEAKICTVNGCKEEVYKTGYCKAHYENYKSAISVNNENKELNVCKISGCDKQILSKGLCSYHYNQFRKHGKILSIGLLSETKIKNSSKICSVEGCTNTIVAKGYCRRHYDKYRNCENPLYEKNDIGNSESKESKIGAVIMNPKEVYRKCSVDGCNDVAKVKGYCQKHYYKFKTYGNPLQENKLQKGRKCLVEGCNEKHKAKGYCQKHYSQYKIKEASENNKKLPKPKAKNLNCKVEGCTEASSIKGYCRRHYKQFLKYNRILTDDELFRIRHLKCMKENCNNKVFKMGYCEDHYNEYYCGDDNKMNMNDNTENNHDSHIEVVENNNIICTKCREPIIENQFSIMNFKPFNTDNIEFKLCHKCSNSLIKWMMKIE